MGLKQILFGFGGRLGRLAYFGYSILAMLVLALVLGGAIATIYTGGSGATVIATVLIIAAVIGAIWCGLALVVKRLHDLNLAGVHAIWIYGVGFAGGLVQEASPALGILFGIASTCIYLWLVFGPGTAGSNQYGANPAAVPVAMGA
jgi:uncharacterized membrane protein YhaH (DUF805 family)